MRVFYIYFWKSYLRKFKKHKWVVVFKGKRHIVNSFKVLVPTESRSRSRNPHAVLYGKASKLTKKLGTVTIS